MRDGRRVVMLNGYRQWPMVQGLIDSRNDVLQGDKPAEDVNSLIPKIINAPTKREERRVDCETG